MAYDFKDFLEAKISRSKQRKQRIYHSKIKPIKEYYPWWAYSEKKGGRFYKRNYLSSLRTNLRREATRKFRRRIKDECRKALTHPDYEPILDGKASTLKKLHEVWWEVF